MNQAEFDKLDDVTKEMTILRMIHEDIKRAVYVNMREWYEQGKMVLTKELYESGRNVK
jgi:hypothetical protein